MAKKSQTGILLLFLLLFLALIVIAIYLILTPKPIPSDQGAIEIHFCPQENCTSIMLHHLDANSKCAIYEMSPFFENQLKQKKVDLVIHYENYDGYGTKVYAKGLMHNKFCVTNNTVMTGSFNPSYAGDLYNDNNLIILESPSLAKNYLNEFMNLKRKANEQTPNPVVLFNNLPIENYFCPRDHCQENVYSALSKANASIYFMIFSFTDDDLGDLVVEKSQSLDIKGVLERSQNSTYSEYAKFMQNNLSVHWDANPSLMHHKVFIIDNATVITGSYNPSQNANKNNYENILIIHNAEIAQAYLKEFERVYMLK
jgi:phosphatidylserine/phosphatidylglycerophosphate/cardiolipin synthase-like enzyme